MSHAFGVADPNTERRAHLRLLITVAIICRRFLAKAVSVHTSNDYPSHHPSPFHFSWALDCRGLNYCCISLSCGHITALSRCCGCCCCCCSRVCRSRRRRRRRRRGRRGVEPAREPAARGNRRVSLTVSGRDADQFFGGSCRDAIATESPTHRLVTTTKTNQKPKTKRRHSSGCWSGAGGSRR